MKFNLKPVKPREPRVDALEASRSERIVRKLNELPGCKAIKRIPHGYNQKGEPDVFGCIRGRHFEFETKRPKKGLEKLQSVKVGEWSLAGAITARVESWEDVEQILKQEGLL